MIEYLVKVLLASSLFLGFYILFLQREKMFRFNRIYLLSTLVLSLITPLFLIHIPEKSVPDIFTEGFKNKETLTLSPDQNSVSETTVGSDQILLSNESEKSRLTKIGEESVPNIEKSGQKSAITYKEMVNSEKSDHWSLVILLGYVLITTFLVGRFIVNLFTILVKIANSKKIDYNGVILVVNKEREELHSFWNYIFIPDHNLKESFSRKELLEHEIAHSKQKHSWDIIFIELIKSVFWFNPVFYLYKKAIQLNHEFLADNAVLKSETDVYEYQKLILHSMEVKQVVSIASNFNYILTKKRLLMMTKKTSSAKAFLLQIVSIPFILILVFVFSNKAFAQAKEESAKLTPEQINKLKMALKMEDISGYLRDSLTDNNQDYIDTITIGEKAYVVSTSKKELEKLFGKDKNNYSVQVADKRLDKVFRELEGEQLEKSFGIKELVPEEIESLVESSNQLIQKKEVIYQTSDHQKKFENIKQQSRKLNKSVNSPEEKDKRSKIKEQVQNYISTVSGHDLSVQISQKLNTELVEKEFNAKVIIEKERKSIGEDMEEFRQEMRKFRKEMNEARKEMKKINYNN